MNNQNKHNIEVEEFSLLPLLKIIWNNKIFVIKSISIAIITSIIIIVSIPKEYTVEVSLAPESGKNTNSGISIFGFSNFAVNENEALNVSLFPNVIKSTPFALELYNIPVKVTDKDEKNKIMPFYQYINTQKRPWWKSIMSFPTKIISKLVSFNKKEQIVLPTNINPFQLTESEHASITSIKNIMNATIDKETNITTISVTLQDPLVTATIADTIVLKLQEYITNYRTKKAIDDYQYQDKLYQKAKKEYYQRQQEYASFIDRNQNLNKQSIKIEEERLRDQLNISSQIYQQAATHLEIVKAKIQENKPVFTIIEPASVPLLPSSPKKMMILSVLVFFSIAISTCWLFFGKNAWLSFTRYIKS